MKEAAVKLYGYWRSSASWRVRIALELKGLAYTYEPVHLVAGQQRETDHRERNPMQQVPVLELEVGGVVQRITQSLAIVEYLDEAFPAPPLMPAHALERARVRELAEVVNSGIQPLHNSGVLAHLAHAATDADQQAWGRHFIARGLAALEALAAARAGSFLVGDAVTLADICLVPQLYQARRFGVDLAPFATLRRVEAACQALPAFQRAHAERQPDAEP
jgi:maleylacetoacetate isomerase